MGIRSAITAMASSLVAMACGSLAASPAATQDWVRHYVITNGGFRTEITQTITASNAVATCSYADADGSMVSMSMDMGDKLALYVTNCTPSAVSLGITNGTIFAWNGSTQFVNAVIGHVIYSPTTNALVFAGVSSVTNSTTDTIPGYFDFYGGRISRPVARTLLGE